MNIILLTNNDLKYPVLHSQLLEVYNSIPVDGTKFLYCKNNELDELNNYSVIGFDKTKSTVFNFLWYIFSVKKMIKSSKGNDFFHIRGFVSAMVFFIAYITSSFKPKFIYDPRGAFITEKNEVNSTIKHFEFGLKKIERFLISKSTKTIVTSQKFKELFSLEYGHDDKYIVNYNCSPFKNNKRDLSISSSKEINVIYVGTINHWHDIEEITKVLKHLRQIFSGTVLNLVFLTSEKHHKLVNEKVSILGYDSLTINSVPYSEVGNILKKMHIGVSIVRPTPSGVIASPIKIADYIQAGLVIVSNRGIGDFDEHYDNYNSAILYEYGNPGFSASKVIETQPHLNRLLASKITCGSIANKVSDIIKQTKH